MAEPIQTYLHDHYSGSTFLVELLEKLQSTYSQNELGSFASELLSGINEDRAILMELIHRVGSAGPDLKDVTGWLAEKATRLKLAKGHPQDLSVFEAVETIGLGILGKRSLWSTLKRIDDPRVAFPDYDGLMKRAEDQFTRVDTFRLGMTRAAFTASF
jgi:hypothetical protein